MMVLEIQSKIFKPITKKDLVFKRMMTTISQKSHLFCRASSIGNCFFVMDSRSNHVAISVTPYEYGSQMFILMKVCNPSEKIVGRCNEANDALRTLFPEANIFIVSERAKAEITQPWGHTQPLKGL